MSGNRLIGEHKDPVGAVDVLDEGVLRARVRSRGVEHRHSQGRPPFVQFSNPLVQNCRRTDDDARTQAAPLAPTPDHLAVREGGEEGGNLDNQDADNMLSKKFKPPGSSSPGPSRPPGSPHSAAGEAQTSTERQLSGSRTIGPI